MLLEDLSTVTIVGPSRDGVGATTGRINPRTVPTHPLTHQLTARRGMLQVVLLLTLCPVTNFSRNYLDLSAEERGHN
jgi:hypothetical protein